MAQRRSELLDTLRAALPESSRLALDCAIATAGRRGLEVCLVGGGVRDLLVGSGHLDLDLVLEGDALELASEVGLALRARVVRHPRFGTAVVHGDGFRIDLARARSERYERPGALPAVRPGTLADDLARRDFTINAMALRLNGPAAGTLVDPTGGRSDLQRRLLRVLHDGSLRDDASRILRAARYAGRLGLRIEQHTASLLERDLPYLDAIGGVRLRHELERIAMEERVGDITRLAAGLSVLAAVHPAVRPGPRELRATGGLAGVAISHRDAVLFSILLSASPRDAEAAIKRLALTGRQASAVQGLLALLGQERALAVGELRASEASATLSAYPTEAIEAFGLLAGPRAAGRAREYLQHWRFVRPRLDGHDIERLGVPHGPRVGEALAALRHARLDGAVNDREDEERFVRALVPRPLARARHG